ncbi:MAG: glycoside hydrolase family 3 protein [Candidatus Margulisbacteria bacterium]|nr:glycoside hydrolase family 3 protein [Candidatus Margulisiibacteriota bacterium]
MHEKICQMIMVGFKGTRLTKWQKKHFQEYPYAGVILYERGSGKAQPRNISSPKQVRRLCAQLRKAFTVSPWIAVDQEGGIVQRFQRKNGFKNEGLSHYMLGRMNDPDRTERYSRSLAKELRELGININFAPVVDVAVNPKNPIIARYGRSFSSNPEKVVKHAIAFINGHHSVGVLTTLKHFPGHGSSKGDTHKQFVDVTKTFISTKELYPFRELIEQRYVPCVMTAHIYNENFDKVFPATLSHQTLNILRNDLKFDGVIITDDLMMNAIWHLQYQDRQITIKEIVYYAIKAGNDVLLFANSSEYDPYIGAKVVQAIKELIKEGKLSEERIDESYQRIMHLKKGYSFNSFLAVPEITIIKESELDQ